MIKGGIGGAKTKTGLKFESRSDLRNLFSKMRGYKVKGNLLFYDGKAVAEFYKKNEIYTALLKKLNISWKERISKRLMPDESIFVLSNKTLFIIEMKFQEVSGSVDEKLQTCDFKKKQYQKLLSGTDIKIEYFYVLSDWFNKSEYKDVLDYIKSVGCNYFFNILPLEELGLPSQ